MTTTNDEYETMLDDCEKRESRLSDSEREIIDSLRHQFDDGFSPSPKQCELLDSIWERATRKG